MKHCFASLASSAVVVSLSVAAAPAQDKPVALRFSHGMPAAHPMHPAAEAWAESIKKASGGTIMIAIHPAQQLGKAPDHYNMARDGIADIVHVNPGHEPGRFPIMGAVELPFNFANSRNGSAALDVWYRKYATREMSDVKYCLTFAQDPATFHFTRRKGVLPADVGGLKVRPANTLIARWVTLLGGSNVEASADVRDALAKGGAEAVTFPWGSTVQLGIDKLTKYHIDSAFYVTEQTWVLNKARYDAMSAAQKKVIDDHCTSEWAFKIAKPWADMEASGRDRIKAKAGHEVYPLTPEELSQWRKSAEPLRAEWAETVRKTGANPKAVLDELRASLANYNAAY